MPQHPTDECSHTDLEAVIREYVREHDEEIHSVVVARPSDSVTEVHFTPSAGDTKHIMNSCTKSFLGTLVGIAVEQGHLTSVDDAALDHLPDFPNARHDARRGRITIGHLLTMSSGIHWPQTQHDNASDRMVASTNWIEFVLAQPMAAEPGTVTNYSNGDTHLISAILARATGVPTSQFARTQLFAPLGISDFRWDSDPQGVSIGSATLYLTPRDMAKLGLLYLADGQWNGKQVVPREWIRTATQAHVEIDTGRPTGYGYYWWVYPEHGMYEAWGGQGQRVACFPQRQAVVVTTADIDDSGPRSSHATGLYAVILQQLAWAPGP